MIQFRKTNTGVYKVLTSVKVSPTNIITYLIVGESIKSYFEFEIKEVNLLELVDFRIQEEKIRIHHLIDNKLNEKNILKTK